ncbi:zona pellucida sperm-binding protein 3-like [Nerophis ophidion]|uniref:zona pellucida sperm-binding protein 3-like n=1 Tax=Nerophis ophidion TaxID=159077 RepID=UPI002AE05A05|nr:zona pellucida sperm-binding protein 3-like [Nerophis ophidion]
MTTMKMASKALYCHLCVALALALASAQDGRWSRGRSDQKRPPVQHVADPRQSSRETLSWRYPDPPAEEEPRFPAHFELKTPEAPERVHVVCGPNFVRVEAEKDLLGTGRAVRSEDVTLGGCPATSEDSHVLVFEAELHTCGSQLLMSEDNFSYVFTLQHTPSRQGHSPIIRTREVSVSIQCQYQRTHDVSSAVKPTWIPSLESKDAEENLYFSLNLMSDDWQAPRPSSQFLLGDMMKFEVTVKQFHHTPLRVAVDSCVATVSKNVDTVPRYAFIGNNGCLFDSQLTGSSSRFLPRSQDDQLRFEMEAFTFQQDDRGVLFITCNLKATAASAAIDFSNKACSFTNRWSESSGVNQACSCCDTDCGETGSRRQPAGSRGHMTRTGAEWEQGVAVGPITVKERPLRKVM